MNIDDLKTQLTPEQYHILIEKGTERPFSSPLLNNKEPGIFKCLVCGNELFTSNSKFNSKTGWPSFDNAIPGSIKFEQDNSLETTRTEVVCASCGSHLGHVFEDGPTSTGKRFCINGTCLVHSPKK